MSFNDISFLIFIIVTLIAVGTFFYYESYLPNKKNNQHKVSSPRADN